jgi:sulfate adenylyltransferase subunit 2
MDHSLPYLQQLESEAIYVIRECCAQFENPVILFSGGKDSIVLVHLCRKAFYPAPVPFPLLHIDTGHNFEETLVFRDEFVAAMGLKLYVGLVEDSIREGKAREIKGISQSRNVLQSITLLDMIGKYGFDAALGGARRDEDRARAKERFFSHRDEFGQWNPKDQRPELWSLYNGRKNKGEHFRVFPLSNWTELDIWSYIAEKKIGLPSLYFTHRRLCIRRDGLLLADSRYTTLPGDQVQELDIRFRTIGDITCTGATISKASSVEDVISELMSSTLSERGGRADDRFSEAAMEDRKRNGYF